MDSGAEVSVEGGGLRGSGPIPSAGYDNHDHRLVVAQLEVEAAAVERLSAAYAALTRARIEATDTAAVRPMPGQLQLVVGG